VFRVQYTFNFNNLTASRFALRTHSQSNNIWTPFSQNYTPLNNIGRVDMSSLSDTVRVAVGAGANIVAGGVEWSYVNTFNNVGTLYIDLRKFTNHQPSQITNVSILDVYSGPVTYLGNNPYWAEYRLPYIPSKLTDGTSAFNSYIRNAGYDNYAFACEVTTSNVLGYKPQRVQFQPQTADSISSMLDRIVTVSDVYLAFKEFADGGGIFGPGSGTQFTSGIQFMNADVNGDGQFNEADCFKLLRHLLGQESLLTTNNLESFMKIIYS